MLPFVVFAVLFQLSNIARGEPTVVTAEVGQENVILPCKCSDNRAMISGVEWTRPDYMTYYVFLHRDDHDVPEDQHPSFKDRVCLQDREMQEGNLSIILKNLTIYDNGLYECHVLTIIGNRKKIDVNQVSVVHLQVVPKDHTAGNAISMDTGHVRLLIGWIFGVAGVLVSACAVGWVIHRKKKELPRHPRINVE